MIMMKCKSRKYYLPDSGRCCDLCPAGSYVRRDCDGENKTQCAACPPGQHTAKENYMRECIICRSCTHEKHKKVQCMPHADTVCECDTGFYCNNLQCLYCLPVTTCAVGEGVKVNASHQNDTVCSPCVNGTFSNVSDYSSPCWKHTSCEAQRRELKVPGSSYADNVCGHLKCSCPWKLSTGIWAGFAMMLLLVLLGVIFWRTKRRSRGTAFFSVPQDPVEPVSETHIHPLPAMNYYGQETSPEKGGENGPSHFATVDLVKSVMPGSFPAAASETINGKALYFLKDSLGIHPEPQEDEWSGV